MISFDATTSTMIIVEKLAGFYIRRREKPAFKGFALSVFVQQQTNTENVVVASGGSGHSRTRNDQAIKLVRDQIAPNFCCVNLICTSLFIAFFVHEPWKCQTHVNLHIFFCLSAATGKQSLMRACAFLFKKVISLAPIIIVVIV